MVDGIFGARTTRALQTFLNAHSKEAGLVVWPFRIEVDGSFGPKSIIALQNFLNSACKEGGELEGASPLNVDSVYGPLTVKALQTFLNHHRGEASIAHLQEVLVADESEVTDMLAVLGVEVTASTTEDDGKIFSCQAFCEAAVAKIPAVLKSAAPNQPNSGCTDSDCEGPGLDLSEAELIKEGLSSPPPQDERLLHANFFDAVLENFRSRPEDRGRMLFHTALSVIFGIFTAPDEVEGDNSSEEAASIVELGRSTSPSRRRGQRIDVSFGHRTNSSRHKDYVREVHLDGCCVDCYCVAQAQ
jgi:hypothetical protein